MWRFKYYQTIINAQRAQQYLKTSNRFDVDELGHGGVIGAVVPRVGEMLLSNRLVYAFLRRLPILRIGRLCLVTRYDDIKRCANGLNCFRCRLDLR